MKETPAKWITKTAIFLAILIAFQAVTAPLQMTLITGSLVNLTLIMTVILAGLSSGITVAAISPIMAFMLGIGPKLLPLIPCIMVGNVVLVLIWYFVVMKLRLSDIVKYVIATISAAVVKFIVLYLLVVQMMIPLLGIPAMQSKLISTMFSLPQLITALIGGVIAILLLPMLTNVARKKGWN
ncbi:MAG: ECF transporter S component [Lactobacillus sp.]|jgi:hypothetical protein|nr:ECF transporter S component [Lactobacillus sp.]